MSETPPPEPATAPTPAYQRRPTELEARLNAPRSPFKGAGRSILIVITLMMVGLAVYMGVYEKRPLMSPYVIAPLVGAVWFGIRLFITFAPTPIVRADNRNV